jgi:hypothetical protein
MNASKLNNLFFIVVFFMACNNSSKEKANKLIVDSIHKSNVSEIKYLGDSVRIEIEKYADYEIKHFIDVKGAKDDGFDNSYSVTSFYHKRDIDSTVIIEKKKIQIKAVLVEDYKTEFSGGKNYFVITKNGDTILDHHLTGYMK